jgi:hypothetical protein
MDDLSSLPIASPILVSSQPKPSSTPIVIHTARLVHDVEAGYASEGRRNDARNEVEQRARKFRVLRAMIGILASIVTLVLLFWICVRYW